MKPSVCVFGPAASGKTSNADAFAKAFGVGKVLDDIATGHVVRIPQTGALILSQEPLPEEMGIRNVHIEQALSAISPTPV